MLNDIYRNLEGRYFYFGVGLGCYFSYIKEVCVIVSLR